MDSHIDSMLSQSMGAYISNFFTSLQGDNTVSKLNNFLKTLTHFNTTVRTHHHSLRQDTLARVHDFASLISSVATNVLRLDTEGETISEELRQDITDIYQRMGQLSIDDNGFPSLRPGSRSLPAYIKPSYTWLLKNLHNPYPSKELKKTISRQSNCSLKDIDAWFVDARKRIGWNSLRKTHFGSKQEKIIAAATHFFKPRLTCSSDDPNAGLLSDVDPDDVYRSHFILISNKAKALYADRFPELTPIVDNSLVAGPATIDTMEEQILYQEHANVARWYPTPHPSPGPSIIESRASTPIDVFEAMNSNTRKRRQSFDGREIVSQGAHDRPSKRTRSDVTTRSDIIISSLPSPAASIDLQVSSEEYLEPESIVPPESTVTPQLSTVKRKRDSANDECHSFHGDVVTSIQQDIVAPLSSIVSDQSILKRKRRLSDGESQRPAKRPHNALCIPRLQTVSDPFPSTKSWLEGSTQTPFQDRSISCENDPSDLADPFPLTPTLDICNGQFGLSSTWQESSVEEYANFITNGECSTSSYPCNSFEFCSEFLIPSLQMDLLQDPISNIIVTTANFPEIDDFQFQSEWDPFCTTKISTMMTHDLSQWQPSIQSDNLPNTPETTTPYKLVETDVGHTNSLDAKRARLQALKAQVSQLEGQLAGDLTA